MVVISIDPGSYSLKYIVTENQKKSITLIDAGEIILSEHMIGSDKNFSQIYAKIIEEISANYSGQKRISLIYPTHLITTRFLTLPIKNKKKAELMIPFQLDEELPYTSSEIHSSFDLEVVGGQTKAMVAITKKDDFEDFYYPLLAKKVAPDFLTNQLSLLANLVKGQKLDNRFCILDFGHETTKAYFFKNGTLVSQHISYVAGKTITEAISKSYQIDHEEAIKYKHENAFVLTDSQLEEVNDSQRKFASLMDEVLSSLISDFKRWDLGYRVSHIESIEHIYITGSSAKIKNIENYLLDKLSYPVAHLSQEINSPSHLPENLEQYINCDILAGSFASRNQLASFLTKEYASEASEDLPLHSISFISLRVAILCLIFILSLFVERFFINRQSAHFDAEFNRVLKTPELEITTIDRRRLQTQPEYILEKLQDKLSTMNNQKSALTEIEDIDRFSPLVELSQFAARKGVVLDQFSNNEQNEIIAVFTQEPNSDENSLVTFKRAIEQQGWAELNTTLNNDSSRLTVRYFGGY